MTFRLLSAARSAPARALPGAILALAALAAAPSFADTYTEGGDVGETLATAAGTGTGAALTSIFGSLSSTTDADLFVIDITTPGAFSATTVNASTDSYLDTQLFLFTISGKPIVANDDEPSGLTLVSTLPLYNTAGNSFGPVAAGRYVLGIALSGYEPVNANGQLLFNFPASTTDLRGPNGGLVPAALANFSGGGFVGGTYAITLTGALAAPAPLPVPEPSAALLLAAGLAAVGVAARRRAASGARA